MTSIGLLSLSMLTAVSLSTISIPDTATPSGTPLPITLQQITHDKYNNEQAKTPPLTFEELPVKHTVEIKNYVAQSYNNCGPAALSMILSTYGTNVTQEELMYQMRPYNSPNGGEDDKSVFPQEFVTYAEKYGFKAVYRPNGDMRKLKQFIAKDIPVVVRTWLKPDEDISHYRIIKGYDDATQTFIQDDSYQGKDLVYTYDQVMNLWQAFNYSYIIVYPKEKEQTVQAILGEDMDEKTAWQHALVKAENEEKADPSNAYNKLNQSVAYYYLEDYAKSVALYDQAKDELPNRILWYQLEPILAYQKVGNDQRIFQISEGIFNSGNKAYSELYQIRGEVYLKEGKKDLAKAEFEKALFYNSNYEPARKALENI